MPPLSSGGPGHDDLRGRTCLRIWPPVALGVPLVAGLVLTSTAGDPSRSRPGRPMGRLGPGRRVRAVERVDPVGHGAPAHRHPAGRTTVLVLQSGPFGLSRNPLYVGLVALDVAIGLLVPSFWALVLVPLGVLALPGGRSGRRSATCPTSSAPSTRPTGPESPVALRGFSALAEHLVDVAPAPGLAGLDAAHHRVAGSWKCASACLPTEESQQPTLPHSAQDAGAPRSRPSARHSGSPRRCRRLGVSAAARWSHAPAIWSGGRSGDGRTAPDRVAFQISRLLGVELAEHGGEHLVVDPAAVADAEQLGPLLPDHLGAHPAAASLGSRRRRGRACPAAPSCG